MASETFEVSSLGAAAARGHDLSRPLTFMLRASVAHSEVGPIKSALEAQGFTVQTEPVDLVTVSLIAEKHGVFSARDIDRISDRAYRILGSAARGATWHFRQVGAGG
jgi:hypothetical protein